MASTQPLGTADVAELAGVKPTTISQHLHRGTIPEPDGYVGGHPWWKSRRIDRWLATRRPPHRPPKKGPKK